MSPASRYRSRREFRRLPEADPSPPTSPPPHPAQPRRIGLRTRQDSAGPERREVPPEVVDDKRYTVPTPRLRDLRTWSERTFEDVSEYSISKDAKTLVYAVAFRKEDTNGVYAWLPVPHAEPDALSRGKGSTPRSRGTSTSTKWRFSATGTLPVPASEVQSLRVGCEIRRARRDGLRLYAGLSQRLWCL